MTLDEIKRNIRAAVAGMNHDQRETLGIALCEVASGEDVEFLRCDRGTMRLWTETKPQWPGAESEESEYARLHGLALKNQLDPGGQQRLLALLDRREAARLALQLERRDRAIYGGRTLAEIQEGGDAA